MNAVIPPPQTRGEPQRPVSPQALPRPAGWDLVAYGGAGLWPAADCSDFLTLPDGRVLLLVAQARDRGAAAAAAVAVVRALLHACPLSSGRERLPFCPFTAPATQPPHVLLGHLNRVLAEAALDRPSLAAFCGVLDPADGTFDYGNAGHHNPRWWRAARRGVESLEDDGPPLGANPRTFYHGKRIEISPGDVLVLGGDGPAAAPGPGDGPCRREDIAEALYESAAQGAEAVATGILARLQDGRGARDDAPLVVIGRR
jgi:serine phosphatase RsbU (regulator of sigma subunit)